MDNFMEALKSIRPSALREVFVERPNVHWSDIGDMEKVKEEIKEAVELPLKEPGAVREDRHKADKGHTARGAAGHGQDAARQGRRDREGGELHLDKGAGGAQQVRGGEREGGEGALQEGEDGFAVHNIHRRDRLDSARPGAPVTRTPAYRRGSSTRCSRRWTACRT